MKHLNIAKIKFCLAAIAVAGLTLAMSSCNSRSDSGNEGVRGRRAMERLQAEADAVLEQVASYMAVQDLDSIRITTSANADISYYIFNGLEMIYWSDNRVCTDSIVWQQADEWHTADWRNARVRYKWHRWGGLRLMSVIPLRWTNVKEDVLERSFSYRVLARRQARGGNWWQRAHVRTNVFFSIIVCLFAAIVIAGVWGLVKSRGFRNMRLQTKFQYLIITLVLSGFLYIFWMLVLYVRKHYSEQQRGKLQAKCRYMRRSLETSHYWDEELVAGIGVPIDIELRELASMYGVDVHVYDLSGRLAGSSTSELFREGVLSSRLSAAVLFDGVLQAGDTTVVFEEQMGAVNYLCAYTRFINGDKVPIGYIAVPYFISSDERWMEVERFLARLLPAYIVVLLLAVCLSLFISRTLVLPIRRLSEKMKNYRFGNKDNHIIYDNHDEVGELAERYNAMVDSLDEAFLRLAQSERDSAWRTMARQIAHEINNPLTPMKLTIQQLQRMKGTERFDEYFAKSTHTLLEQMDTLSRIASSFSTFAKMPEVRTSEVDIAEKLSASIGLFADNEQGIPVRYVGANKGVSAWADSEQITEVFNNILKNALQALEGREDGDIIVILQEQEYDVLITISDNGGGIAEDIRERIFMPNFTTKSTGTGLGLAISKNIVEGSGGNIWFETSEKGTKFFVRLKKSRNFARHCAQKAQ